MSLRHSVFIIMSKRDIMELRSGRAVNLPQVIVTDDQGKNCPLPILSSHGASEHHSTPYNSPSSVRNLNYDSPVVGVHALNQAYEDTPVGEGVGTRLLLGSSDINCLSTAADFEEYLRDLDGRINDYGDNLQAEEGWEANITTRYMVLLNKINKAKLLALDHHADSVVLKCSELSRKLEDFKLKWSLRTSGTESFHGFSTQDVSTESSNQEVAKADTNNILKRLTTLESVATSINHLKSMIPQISERVAILENHVPSESTHVNSDILESTELLKRISSLEEHIGNVSEIKRMSGAIEALENTMAVTNKVVEELANSVLSQKEAIKTVDSQQSADIKALENQLSDMNKALALQKSVVDTVSSANNTFCKEFMSFQASITNDVLALQAKARNSPILGDGVGPEKDSGVRTVHGAGAGLENQQVNSWLESQHRATESARNNCHQNSTGAGIESQQVNSWLESQRRATESAINNRHQNSTLPVGQHQHLSVPEPTGHQQQQNAQSSNNQSGHSRAPSVPEPSGHQQQQDAQLFNNSRIVSSLNSVPQGSF